jgi:hypothetical protein
MPLNPNATLVAERLKGAGYTRAQIAGVLGNFQLESGFNPRINEGGAVGGPRGVGGYGLGQWTGDRQTALVNFAKGRKADPGNTGIQADFLLHELSGPEKAAAASLRKAVSPEEASRRFLTDFERAGVPKTNERMQAARALYDKLSFLDKPQQTATSSFAAPPTSTNKSVEDILASVIGGAVKPELEDKNNKAKTLVEMVMQSVLPGVLSTTSPAIPPNPFALY